MRTGPNVCILNLALGDFLSLVVNLPLSYWDIVHRDQGLCGLFQHKTMLMYTLLVWGIASGLALPTLYTATVDVRCLTARLLKQSAKEMPGETQLSAAQGREKVANMVVVLTLVFSVSYVPNFLLRVLFAWAVSEHDSDFTFFVSFASFCLFFLNSCFNPIALLSISIPIRDLFLKYIRWHRLKTKDTQGMFYTSGRQHSLKCATGKRCRPVCTVVQQEEVESIPVSSYECTMVHCVLCGTDKVLSGIVPGTSQWFFHFGEEIVVAWTHIGSFLRVKGGRKVVPTTPPHSSAEVKKACGSTSMPPSAFMACEGTTFTFYNSNMREKLL
ncbi:hypothetical protein ANN_08386 [Periplaneta americana]|uniref:G-protein coupled receptors family 1 profile domain-containing protein n=1 Tax=Periplaneta americana TaxID=6978 RepID=A0ABQ8T199_PERAM|nr:hypothetical protein ANN_08386 [Periplaneta americana]